MITTNRTMNENLVTIQKDGKLVNINQEKLNVGDIVVIQTADLVSADLKLIEANGLEIDEFEITGEILPVVKRVQNEDVIVYSGSRVIRGSGKGIVTATGKQTEYGRILAQEEEQSQAYKFRVIDQKYFRLAILLLPALFILLARMDNKAIIIAFFTVFSLILNLLQNDPLYKFLIVSRESKVLERNKIQIRDMRALEQMNDLDIMCFDKTGVLTTRQLEIKNLYFSDRIYDTSNGLSGFEKNTAHLVKTTCALCNDILFYEKAEQANPVDRALLKFAQKNGVKLDLLLSQYQRIYEKPFDSENRYMVCGFQTHEAQNSYFAKGDPEIILKMCDQYMTSAGALKKINFDFWLAAKSNIVHITKNGDTVIALAYSRGDSAFPPKKYTFLCLLQLENLLQQGAQYTIQKISERGIRNLLLTGDKAETAAKIGATSGITKGVRACLTGSVMERMELPEIARQASYCSVFARLIPSQKGLLIRQLQQKGHFVAMIGDGANDGIALKVADIGISFTKNSSPIARRFSKILINDLPDLITLLKSAERIRLKIRWFKFFRISLLAGVFYVIYGWGLGFLRIQKMF